MRKFILFLSCAFILLACNNAKNGEQATGSKADSTEPSTAKFQGYEFGDSKYVETGKKYLKQFEAGDIDNWINMFSDNAVYAWSSLDSLVGKKAIADYWKNRRKTVIDSMTITNDIWIPIKVNQPQKGPDLAGIWLLNWQQVTAKYKSGKKITFWVHVDSHFNDAGLVDRAVHYVDRSVINAAIAGK